MKLTNKIIFFLPAGMRAFFYCRDPSLEEVLTRYDVNLSLARYDWLDINKGQSQIKQNEFMLKKKLNIPSFFLIRRNSDIERHFLCIENELHSEKYYHSSQRGE